MLVSQHQAPDPKAPHRTPSKTRVKYHHLFVTGINGMLDALSVQVMSLLESLSLQNFIDVEFDEVDVNLSFLKECIDGKITIPQPCLTTAVGGCSAAVVYHLGDDITRELQRLHKALVHA